MTPNQLTLLLFLSAILGVILALVLNVRIVRSKIRRWDSNSTIWFVLSIGNFGQKQVDMWKRRGGYNDDEARIIIRYQLWCLIEIPVAFLCAHYSNINFLVRRDYGDSALNSHNIEDRERRHGSPCMMPATAVPSQLSALSP
jgi:hypothetical protein